MEGSMLSSLSRLGGDKDSITLLPNPRIKLPVGEVTHAWQEKSSPFGERRDKPSAAQRTGLRYEEKIAKYLASIVPPAWKLLRSPWFAYCDGRPGRHYCQPDIVLDWHGGFAIVVETKIAWTSDAWWQLRDLYLPVLASTKRWEKVIPLCITRSFDPHIPVPGSVDFVQDVFEARPGRFSVMVVR